MISDDCIQLWIDIFGDGEDFIRRFYAIPDVKVYTQYDGDTLCGMVNRVPITYGNHTGGYIYAACTRPEYRGHGIFRQLLKEAESDMQFMMLIPAEKDLYEMYRKLGYDNTAYSKFPFTTDTVSGFTIPFDGDYNRLYGIYVQNSGKNEFIKPFGMFQLALREFAEKNMIYYNCSTDGFIIYETKGKNIFKIYDLYCKNNIICDTIDEHESGVYKIIKIIDDCVVMPERMKVNLFMEV